MSSFSVPCATLQLSEGVSQGLKRRVMIHQLKLDPRGTLVEI